MSDTPADTEKPASKDVLGALAAPSAPPAAQDPVRMMLEILTTEGLGDGDKQALVRLSQERFRNRRRMAYLALYAIFGILIFLGLATIVDAFTAEDVLAKLEKINGLLISIIGFLTTVVLAYIGAAAWRPSS